MTRSSETQHSALTLTALGIVFGDIGTSPLYAVREAFNGPHAIAVNQVNIFGVLSLIVWSLILVISIKYLLFILSADNKGEGGVLALTALAAPPKFAARFRSSAVLLAFGLFGSALLFGDGVITPAISVLSAVEGLKIVTPQLEPFVIPLTLIILWGIFFVQKKGTALIGSIFGPVIFVWFLTLGSLGAYGILNHPDILFALSPLHAVNYFMVNGIKGMVVLSAVFLVVTGGEAMYADMGHLGKRPIQKAWFFVALPGLLLNYFGQGALILNNPESALNPFYLLAPGWALLPLVGLATMATIIASQALISGVFSLTRQAVQMGYFPRLRVVHTSSHAIGQIYIPVINWTLFVLTAALVIGFGSSSALASAYGIAVSMTMVITTALACAVAVQRWRWKWSSILILGGVFILTDLIFLAANLTKVADGGWFPLLMGAIVFTLMTTWRKGRKLLAEKLAAQTIPLEDFLKQVREKKLASISGSAFFMSGTADGTPYALVHNVKHNKCLHSKNAVLTVLSEDVPYVQKNARIEIRNVGESFYRIIARYGFMDAPDINEILDRCAEKGVKFDSTDTTFFLGRETILPSDQRGMALWREHLFSLMSRNATRATAYYNIPPNQVVEMGMQIEI